MIVPRAYQHEAVDSLYTYFSNNKGNPLIAMPTATGKSIVIAMFLESIFKSWVSQKVLVLTHVKELIQQNYAKLLDFWPTAPAGINSAGLRQRDIHRPIIFAGIASVSKNAAAFGHVDLVIVDEAHLISPNDETMYQRFIGMLMVANPNLKVIGLTATPWRLGHGSIIEGGIFTDLCFDLTTVSAFNRLIAEGYIAPLVPKRTSTQFDLDGVHVRGGDYIPAELQVAVDKEAVTLSAIQESIYLGADRKCWLVFCSGIEHAEHTSDIMNHMGVPNLTVHSRMAVQQRDAAIAALRQGTIRAVVNNNVLTTGFDHPAIDMIVMLRPTESTVLWVQMLGRGTRPWVNKKDCLVLDFAGNTRRLGPINDPVIPRKKGSGKGEAPVKECPQCHTYNHASVRECSECGHEFAIIGALLHTAASTDELIRGDLPDIVVVPVEHVTYQIHKKKERPDSIKVSYHCGMQLVLEFVCLEHQGFARRKAHEWWRKRSLLQFQRQNGREHTFTDPLPVIPETSLAAIATIDRLPLATHLKIVQDGKYPQLLDACFDGTAFGTQEVSDAYTGPTSNIYHGAQPQNAWVPGKVSKAVTAASLDDMDDDIPFMNPYYRWRVLCV